MGDIKSTLDLILEKTRHLSLTEEEKSSLKKQDLTRTVRGIVGRFLAGESDARSLGQQLSQMPPEDRAAAPELCLESLLDKLSPFSDNDRALAGVETVAGTAERGRWAEAIRSAAKPVLEEQQAGLVRLEAGAREALAAKGLKGPALKPSLTVSPVWEEERERLEALFRESLRRTLGNPD
jgi:hypothetical protein